MKYDNKVEICFVRIDTIIIIVQQALVRCKSTDRGNLKMNKLDKEWFLSRNLISKRLYVYSVYDSLEEILLEDKPWNTSVGSLNGYSS